ncbi:sulfotransferase family protein [Nitzschia inconspicua]|uniref:Sulfotransferase family protein n=1 Tax=Nitzschia inconspicua TaxID=303405 RepID=A0A9K3L7S3_9STRA|nr:sulfotransferase family protein [Nitzschia inconspicua]
MARQGRGQRGGGGRNGGQRRGGGRMMTMPGRGRGGGRGQQQQQPAVRRQPPSYLTYYNQYVSLKITSFLTQDERKVLGEAYPKFKPRELTEEQKKAMEERQKKIIEAKKNQVCIADMVSKMEGNNDTKDATTQGVKEETSVDTDMVVDGQERPKEQNDQVDNDTTVDGDTENKAEDSESKDNKDGSASIAQQNQLTPEQKAAREAQLSSSLTDCHTLLARLNTKRLYRRMRYLKKKDPDNFDITKIYPYHKTTEQIAIYEWEKLLTEYKQAQRKKFQEQERLAEEAARLVLEEEEREKEKKGDSVGSKDKSIVAEEKKQDVEPKDLVEKEEPKLPSPLPSKCELLMFSPCPRAVAVLASYPRSGNSLLRTLYERTCLRVTGSDMRGGLEKHDLVGEAATQTNCVQFVKTHYPERMGTPPFRVNRAVLLVRNPYDALESYFNLMTTNTHTTSLNAEERKKHEKIFAEMAKKEILVWRDFHEYWLQQNIPLLVIRYEDLIRYTDKVIAKVLRFVLEVNNMQFFEDRIDRAIREEQIEKLGSYKPRSGGIGKSLTKGVYSPELLQELNAGILSTMAKFGYDEMLVPNPSEWKLEPLDQLGVYIPGTAKQPLVINQKGLVRGPKRQTNWRAVKAQMEMKDRVCTCYKCLKGSR